MIRRTLAALAILACSATHAQDFTDAQVAQLEAFATKWERDAATLLSGQIPGDSTEFVGRAMGFQRAADDIRQMLNRPAPVGSNPRPWPVTSERGTAKLLDLILPTLGGGNMLPSGSIRLPYRYVPAIAPVPALTEGRK